MQSVRRVWPLAGLVLLLPGVARAQPLGRVDPDESSVTVNLASVPADGVSQALVTVHVRDRLGRPVRNRTVTLLASGPAGVQLLQPEERTDHDGIARGAVRSTTTGVALLTARVGPLSVELTDHPGVTFTPAPGLAWLRHGVGDSLALGVAALDSERVAVVGDLRWTPTTFGPGDPDQVVLTPLVDGPGGDPSGSAGFTLVLGADGAIERAATTDGYLSLYGAEPLPGGASTALAKLLSDRPAIFNPDGPDELVVSPLLPRAPLFVRVRLDGQGVATAPQRLVLGSGYLDVLDMRVSPDGGVVLIGSHQSPNDTVVLDPLGAAQTIARQGVSDALVARFDASGALLWSRPIAGPGVFIQAFSVAALPDGDVAVAVSFGGTITLGGGEPTEVTVTSTSSTKLLVARYGPTGALRWASIATGAGREFTPDLAVAPDGGLLVTGFHIEGPTTLGAGEPNQVTLVAPSASTPHGFLARFEADGALGWVVSMGGVDETGSVAGQLLALRPDGEVLLLSLVAGEVVFGPGEPNETTLVATQNDMVLAAFAPTGELRAARVVASGFFGPRDMTLLGDGSLVLVGEFYQPAVFDPGLPTERALPHTEGFTPQPFMARWRP